MTNENKPILDYSHILKFEPKRVNLGEVIDAGKLIRFSYGQRSEDKPGGWKNDPRPIIVVLYDDKEKYIEGININYFTTQEIGQFFALLSKYGKPIINEESGQQLYKFIKDQAPDLLKKAYRKFKRESIVMAFEYQADILGAGLNG